VKESVEKLFLVCLLVFGCLLAFPGGVRLAYAIVSIADDFKCKNQDCKGSVVLTWSSSSKKFTDGCDAAKCTGSCAYCGGTNTDHPYCYFSKGDSCEADAQSFRYDDCGKQVSVACAKAGKGPSACCPTTGGAATTTDCKAPRCSNP